MEDNITIETARLSLRRFNLTDVDGVFEILSDEETTMSNGGFHAYSDKGQEFMGLMNSFTEQLRYSVVLKESRKIIGTIVLMEDERAVKAYELGFVINKKYRRQGYAYEAITGLMDYYFKNTEVEMFTAGHFPFNEASAKLIGKLGFICEGFEKNALRYGDNQVADFICYYKEKE